MVKTVMAQSGMNSRRLTWKHVPNSSADRRMKIIAALITAEGISRVLDFVGERVAD
jgi:hypothetical protein